MIVTDSELSRRLFEVLGSLSEEEKTMWRNALIAWANEKEEAQP